MMRLCLASLLFIALTSAGCADGDDPPTDPGTGGATGGNDGAGGGSGGSGAGGGSGTSGTGGFGGDAPECSVTLNGDVQPCTSILVFRTGTFAVSGEGSGVVNMNAMAPEGLMDGAVVTETNDESLDFSVVITAQIEPSLDPLAARLWACGANPGPNWGEYTVTYESVDPIKVSVRATCPEVALGGGGVLPGPTVEVTIDLDAT